MHEPRHWRTPGVDRLSDLSRVERRLHLADVPLLADAVELRVEV